MKTLPAPSNRTAGETGLRPAAATLALAAALGLSACGGGSDTPTPAPSPSPPPSVPVVTNSCQAFPDLAVGSLSGSLPAATGTTGPVTYSVVSQPASGTLSLSGTTGGFTYTPTTNSRGYLDSFTFKVTNQQGQSAQATAQLVVGKRRIMPLGDSITAGVESYTDSTGDLPSSISRIGYRKRLQELLAAGGYATDFVGGVASGSGAGIADADHEGHSGETTAYIDNNINGFLASSRPDLVLLHIGTNDHTANVSNVNAALSKASTWSSSAANQPVKLILAKIIDQRPESTLFNAVAAFNSNLQSSYNTQWADSANANPQFRVRLADMFSVVNPATDLTPIATDTVGLHPNTSGYNKMAQKWYDTMVQEGMVVRCP